MKTMIPPRTYYMVGAALIVLAAITAVLSTLPLGPFNGPIAILIAVAKAVLIVLFFMHIRVSSGVVRLASGLGVAWLTVLFALSLSDYVSRGAIHIPGK